MIARSIAGDILSEALEKALDHLVANAGYEETSASLIKTRENGSGW